MSWTDERVEALKKLYATGLSASQIARELGGVSRNAVIGKIHRLGLEGRAEPSEPKTRAKPPRLTRPARPVPTPQPMRNGLPWNPKAVPEAERKPWIAPEKLEARANVEVAAPDPEQHDLSPNRWCKWPIGDPLDDGFKFCSHRALADGPYCPEHRRVAYQPSAGTKKTSTAELARSLRRYI